VAKTLSFGDLAAKIQGGVAKFNAEKPETLMVAGTVIQIDAMARIGHYQAGWPQLAPATQEERVRLGFTANDPLLRTGELREAIRVRVLGAAAVAVGVDDGDMGPIAHGQEFGNPLKNLPPRPFIGPAGEEMLPKASNVIGKALETAIEE
jgi:hypothetical protein